MEEETEAQKGKDPPRFFGDTWPPSRDSWESVSAALPVGRQEKAQEGSPWPRPPGRLPLSCISLGAVTAGFCSGMGSALSGMGNAQCAQK